MTVKRSHKATRPPQLILCGLFITLIMHNLCTRRPPHDGDRLPSLYPDPDPREYVCRAGHHSATRKPAVVTEVAVGMNSKRAAYIFIASTVSPVHILWSTLAGSSSACCTGPEKMRPREPVWTRKSRRNVHLEYLRVCVCVCVCVCVRARARAGRQKDLGSIPLQQSSLQKLWSVDTDLLLCPSQLMKH